MIPLAALAITVTSASAFTGTDWISKLDLDLTDSEKAALEDAATIRQEAEEEAKAVLEAAGLDETDMQSIHEAMHEAREAEHADMKEAIEANDYDAFLAAVADTPMADKIDSEEAFAKFVEAHELREAGKTDEAEEIMTELGFEKPEGRGMFGGGRGGFGPKAEADGDQ